MPILWDVLEEHLNEAAFLWVQWETALDSPRYSLADAERAFEERLHAHLDGLRIGGPPAAEKLLVPALEGDEADKLAAAALALLEGGEEELRLVVGKLVDGADEVRPALGRVLQVSGDARLEGALRPLLEAESPEVRAAVLDVFAGRELDPGPALFRWIEQGPPAVQVAGLRAARGSAQPVDAELLRALFASEDPAVRDEALALGAILGHRAAWAACREAVSSGTPGHRQAMLLLALGGEAEDLELLLGASQGEEQRLEALWALGFSGRVAAAERSLALVRDENAARLAGEAFSAITGLALEGKYALPDEEPAEEPVTLEAEDLDANLVPDAEAQLPLPAPEAVEAWWQAERKRFEPARRYLRGEPYEHGAFFQALEEGPLRRRHALALELALRSQGKVRVPTRAFSQRQRERLAAARGVRGVTFGG